MNIQSLTEEHFLCVFLKSNQNCVIKFSKNKFNNLPTEIGRNFSEKESKANHVIGRNQLFVRTRWKFKVRLPMVATVSRSLHSIRTLMMINIVCTISSDERDSVVCGGCCLSLVLVVLSVAHAHMQFQLHVYGHYTGNENKQPS